MFNIDLWFSHYGIIFDRDPKHLFPGLKSPYTSNNFENISRRTINAPNVKVFRDANDINTICLSEANN